MACQRAGEAVLLRENGVLELDHVAEGVLAEEFSRNVDLPPVLVFAAPSPDAPPVTIAT